MKYFYSDPKLRVSSCLVQTQGFGNVGHVDCGCREKQWTVMSVKLEQTENIHCGL